MCPGGQVVAAASEEGRAVTNGMSFHARAGKNANAAVVVSVGPQDFDGDAKKAIAFQRMLEERAYAAGGGGYAAPAQGMGAFLAGRAGLPGGPVQPTYPRGVRAAEPVSYTHLDVYKRQGSGWRPLSWRRALRAAWDSIS